MSSNLKFPVLRCVLLTLLACAIAYAGRLAWWQVSSELRPPLGLFWLVILPVVLCGAAIFLSILGGIGTYLLIQSRSLAALILFVMCTGFVFLLPLPSTPPLPEALHFTTYRADYESVVELVAQGKLKHCSALPSRYAGISRESCIQVNRDDMLGLVIIFYPLETYYHAVAYIEHPNSSGNRCGIADYYVEARLDTNWYVCLGEWN